MKKIFKYSLAVTDDQQVVLPLGTKVLSVAEQHGNVVLYAVVNESEHRVEHREVRIHGTGHNCSETLDDYNFNFIGTVKLQGGALMFHVFVK